MAKPKKEDIEKTIEEAEELKDVVEDTPEEPVAEDIEPEEVVEEDAPKEPEIDYKKKFSESSREAQKIAAKNRKINEAIDEASKISEPTDDEMRVEFPDWDEMEPFAKKLATEAVVGKKFRENLERGREEAQKIEKWNEQVDKFVEDPETFVKNPELDGRQDEFKLYATAPSNTSIPFDVLVPAFLHNSSIPSNRGGMFPKGSAGPIEPETADDKLGLEESRKLRETNYNKWVELLKKGKVKIDID